MHDYSEIRRRLGQAGWDVPPTASGEVFAFRLLPGPKICEYLCRGGRLQEWPSPADGSHLFRSPAELDAAYRLHLASLTDCEDYE